MRIQSNEQFKSIIYQINIDKQFSIYILKNSDLFKKPLSCAIGLISGEKHTLDFNKQNNKLLKQICENEKNKIIAYDIKYIANKLNLLEINLLGKLSLFQ